MINAGNGMKIYDACCTARNIIRKCERRETHAKAFSSTLNLLMRAKILPDMSVCIRLSSEEDKKLKLTNIKSTFIGNFWSHHASCAK